MKIYYFHTLKALWDGQGKIKMCYGMSRVKRQLLGKRCIIILIGGGEVGTLRIISLKITLLHEY